MIRIIFILACTALLTSAVPVDKALKTKAASLTANDIVNRIKGHVTCAWSDETVDTFKAGNPDMQVTGVATTFLATLDVLKRAKAKGLNFIITHEPTFYNHQDNLDQYGDLAMVDEKKKFIEDNNLVVWRFHDHWHRTSPDGILTGEVQKLGWTKYAMSDGRPYLYKIPSTTLRDLAAQLKKTLHTNTIRVVGDPDMKLTNVALVLGASGAPAQIHTLQNDDVEALLIGETHEWETVEYVRDLVNSGKKKALIIVGHANSEEYGMVYCAEWLKGFVKEVPVEFVPAGDPFWTPQ